jgi:PrtD family type I secretion system ABC transporter
MHDIFRKSNGFLVYVGLFSFVIELMFLVPSIYMMQIFDRVMSSRSIETLSMLTLIGLFAVVLGAGLESLRSKLLLRFGVTVQRLLGPPVLETVLRTVNQTEVTKNGLDDVKTIQSFLTGQGIKAFFALPWIPVYWLIIYLFHPLLAAVAILASLILFTLTYVEDQLTASRQKEANQTMRNASGFATTALANSEVVGALGMFEAVTQRWSGHMRTCLNLNAEAQMVASTVQGAAKFVRYGAPVLAMAMATFLIIQDQSVSPGIMIASTIILGRAMAPMDQVLGAWKSFVNVREAYANLKSIFAEAQRVSGSVQLPAPTGKLSVERLLFFLGRDRHILNGVNFSLRAGESLGVIGPSASGKTSLARLLVGLHKPSDGAVRLDGADVHLWAQRDLGQHIGYLPQNVALLPGTVADNIARMQDPEINSERIINAANRAHIHELILKLPKAYATEVGDGGSLLPGGQRQLIGLARALYGEPKFVVLDEPNANLDGQSELALVEILGELKAAGVTLVIITHKPSIIKDVDKLLVLRQGQQILFGANQEVLRELNGVSASIRPADNDNGSPEAQAKGLSAPLVKT